jgi:hypothetical protein
LCLLPVHASQQVTEAELMVQMNLTTQLMCLQGANDRMLTKALERLGECIFEKRQLQGQLDHAQRMIHTDQQLIAHLRAQQQEVQQRCQELQAQLTVAVSGLQASRQRSYELQTQLHTQLQHSAYLASELNTAKLYNDGLKAELQTSQQLVSSLRQQLGAAQGQGGVMLSAAAVEDEAMSEYNATEHNAAAVLAAMKTTAVDESAEFNAAAVLVAMGTTTAVDVDMQEHDAAAVLAAMAAVSKPGASNVSSGAGGGDGSSSSAGIGLGSGDAPAIATALDMKQQVEAWLLERNRSAVVVSKQG